MSSFENNIVNTPKPQQEFLTIVYPSILLNSIHENASIRRGELSTYSCWYLLKYLIIKLK